MFISCFGRTRNVFILTSLLLLLVGCPQFTTPSSFVVVPDLTGMTQTEATSALTEINLRVGNVRMESSATVPVGQVFRQEPLADTEVNSESEVTLIISAGSGSAVAVPNLVGMTQADARTALTSAGLTAGTIKQESSMTVPAGNVMSQNPTAGVSVMPGSSVALVISRGPQHVTVPEVTGVAQVYAEAAIRNTGLVVGTVTQEYSTTVPAGSVIRQTPVSGSSVERGSMVDLVIAVSVPGFSVPNVIGMMLDAARTAITNAGLVVGTVTQEYRPALPAGQVINQNPTVATEVAPGSSVNLVVSTRSESHAILTVLPALREVNADSGTTTFEVSNKGTGTMNWTASVTSENWLRITAGDHGTNNGKITLAYDANLSTNSRAGTILVTVSATGNTALVNVQQAGTLAQPAPTITRFTINNEAASTANTTVKLNNTCTGSPTHYMASESSSFSGAKWHEYRSDPTFTLSAGLGIKTVYFKTKNAAGESNVMSDTIMLSQQSTGSEYVFDRMWPELPQQCYLFDYPHDLAVDTSGNIYVTNSLANRIQKFGPDGTFILAWGSSGSGNGQLYGPAGIALDTTGNVYVVDGGNSRIQKFTSDGIFLTKWGTFGTGNGQFCTQNNGVITVDAANNVYVGDSNNCRIQKFTADGTFLTKWGSLGQNDGQFNNILGITVDATGNVCVASGGRIQKFTTDGTFLTKWGSSGTGEGQFVDLCDVAVDAGSNIYSLDIAGGNVDSLSVYGGHNFRYRIKKFTADGTSLAQWDGEFTGNEVFPSILYSINFGLTVDAAGNVYVVNGYFNRIQKYASDGTFLTSLQSYGTDNCHFYRPNGVVVDNSGNVYITDTDNHRIQKFTSDGTFLTKWGSYGTGDGQFNAPGRIAVDKEGNVYVTEGNVYATVGGLSSSLKGCYIQKFKADGTFLKKWGSRGTLDGQFLGTAGIAVDTSGNVYVADALSRHIQKFSSDGIFLNKWGGDAGLGCLALPTDVAVDASGNVYVVDSRYLCVKKYTSDGVFLTMWGSMGDGLFNFPIGITVDDEDNVYVTDCDVLDNRKGYSCIQKFTSNGVFLKKWGSFGEGIGQLSNPCDLAVDASGNVYVADTGNNRIQKFRPE